MKEKIERERKTSEILNFLLIFFTLSNDKIIYSTNKNIIFI